MSASSVVFTHIDIHKMLLLLSVIAIVLLVYKLLDSERCDQL